MIKSIRKRMEASGNAVLTCCLWWWLVESCSPARWSGNSSGRTKGKSFILVTHRENVCILPVIQWAVFVSYLIRYSFREILFSTEVLEEQTWREEGISFYDVLDTSHEKQITSLARLFKLDPSIVVLCGHYENTTIGYESRFHYSVTFNKQSQYHQDT